MTEGRMARRVEGGHGVEGARQEGQEDNPLTQNVQKLVDGLNTMEDHFEAASNEPSTGGAPSHTENSTQARALLSELSQEYDKLSYADKKLVLQAVEGRGYISRMLTDEAYRQQVLDGGQTQTARDPSQDRGEL